MDLTDVGPLGRAAAPMDLTDVDPLGRAAAPMDLIDALDPLGRAAPQPPTTAVLNPAEGFESVWPLNLTHRAAPSEYERQSVAQAVLGGGVEYVKGTAGAVQLRASWSVSRWTDPLHECSDVGCGCCRLFWPAVRRNFRAAVARSLCPRLQGPC